MTEVGVVLPLPIVKLPQLAPSFELTTYAPGGLYQVEPWRYSNTGLAFIMRLEKSLPVVSRDSKAKGSWFTAWNVVLVGTGQVIPIVPL